MASSHDDDSRNRPFLMMDAVQDVDGVAVRVSGELDIRTVPQLLTHHQHCLAACAPGTALVVELSKVSFLASTGIAALIIAAQLAWLRVFRRWRCRRWPKPSCRHRARSRPTSG